MSRRSVCLIACVLVIAACGDDAGPVSSLASDTTSAPSSSSTTIVQAASDDTLSVLLDGVVWQVPRVACAAEADPEAVATAAAAAAEQVRVVVADRASGWPTTTVASPADRADFLQIEILGPLALALADLAGSSDPIVTRWSDFEAGYADAAGGWGPVTEISSRLPSWRAIGARLVPEIEAACDVSTGGVPTPSAAAASDLRFVDGGDLGLKGTVRVTVGPDDVSILAHARTSDSDELVFVTAVLDPNGEDVGDVIGLEYGELSNYGEAAVFFPIRAEVALIPGEYRIAFEATSPIVESGAIVKSGDPDAEMAVDVVFWMATTVDYDRTALEQRFRSVGSQMFARHGISVGTITFVDPPPEIVDRYSVLDFRGKSDADLRSLCREMSSSIGAVRAVNFAIVDRLDDGDPDGTIEGSASGLPGTAMLTNSDLSCVAGMAAIDEDFGGRDLFDRAIVVWHEAGHHFGLYHTSEGDGLYFDLFDDTPECRIENEDSNDDDWIDVYECDGLDADNFMFYDGDGTGMTDDQAWMMRRHPLLYPTE
jgi:hypothetical protein